MLERMERRNRAIWEGHYRVFEDVTHVIGGMGIALILSPLFRRQAKPIGFSLVALSGMLHAYAFMNRSGRSIAESLRAVRR